MNNVVRHLFSSVTMALCGTAVLWGVYWMNEQSQPPPKKEKLHTADFKVEKKKPPKPKRREQPQRRQQMKTSTAPPAPMPNLGSAISGVSFNLPQFENLDIGAGLGDKLIGETSKQTAMTADVVDDPPRPRSTVAPQYPEQARQRGLSGYVTLKIKVTASGHVMSPRVVDAKPRGVFEEAALVAVRQWEFDPGVYQGNAVEVWANQTLRFELN